MRAGAGFVGVVTLVAATVGACGGGGEPLDQVASTASTVVTSTSRAAQPPASAETAPTTSTTSTLGPPYVGPLHFDWPQDCAVPVTQASSVAGETSTLHYDLEIGGDVDGLLVSYAAMRLAELNGRPVSTERSEQLLPDVQEPTYRVAPDGTGIGVVDVAGLVEDFSRIDPAVAELPASALDLVDSNLTATWEGWVGIWAGLGEVVGEHEEFPVPVAHGGAEYTAHTVIDSLATPAATASLRTTQVIEGDDFLLALHGVTAVLGADEASQQLAGTSGRTVITMEVVTDPSTLRPLTAAQVQLIELTSANGSTEVREDRRSWHFDWANSTCR